MKKYLSILFALVLLVSFSLVTAAPAGANGATFVLDSITFNSDYGPDRGYVTYIQPYDPENQFHSLPGQAIEQYGNPGDAPLGPWSQGDWFNFEYGKPFGGGEIKSWGAQNYVVVYWWNPCVGDYLPINGTGDDIYFYQPDDGLRPMGILYQGEWRMFDAGTNGLSNVRGEDFWWDLSDAGVAEGDTIEALAWWGNALGHPGLMIEKKFPDDHKEQYPGPYALDMDGDGSTEPLTFVGGGTSMSYHDPFYMGIKYGAVVFSPPEVWVDDDYFFGGDNDGHTWCYDAFATIQDGIDAVAEGGTVHVAAGTYDENLTIGVEGLTLQAASSPVLAGTIDVGNGAHGVTIDGFTIQPTSGDAVHVRTAGNVTVTGCTIVGQGPTGGVDGIIYTHSPPATAGTVTYNTISDCELGIYLDHDGLYDFTVTGNTIEDCRKGIGLGTLSGATIDDNDVSGCTQIGIEIRGSANITDNTVQNNQVGIWVGSDVEIHSNNIEGNIDYGVQNVGVELLDATCNWWGDPSGPSGEGPGSGDAVSEHVSFLPWLIAPAPGGPCVGGMPPMELKTEAKDELASIYPTGDKKVDKGLEKAIKHLDKSMDEDLWEGDAHLEAKHGKKVFDEEKKVVKELKKLIDKTDASQDVKDECQAVIGKLCLADGILARTACEEAYGGDPKELEKCEKELEKAEEELGKGRCDKAIDHFKKAWEHAQKAMK